MPSDSVCSHDFYEYDTSLANITKTSTELTRKLAVHILYLRTVVSVLSEVAWECLFGVGYLYLLFGMSKSGNM